MGWILTGLGIGLIVAVVAGAALTLCKRYAVGWQWSARNIWSVCEEYRQRLSWLWAPREEKVGLVKAQHPTAQTVPGLYRQAGNASQDLLRSESDLRLDSQGAFTRFESVDRDLHPPVGATAIPPQPLRPAPQPRPIARPRPSPLQAPCASDVLRMQDVGPAPLTPPPQMLASSMYNRRENSAFTFSTEEQSAYNPRRITAPVSNDQLVQRCEYQKIEEKDRNANESTRQTYAMQNPVGNGFKSFDVPRFGSRDTFSRDFEPQLLVQGKEYASWETQSNALARYETRSAKNDARNPKGDGWNLKGGDNASTTAHTIIESIYGPHAATVLQGGQTTVESQSLEMKAFGMSLSDLSDDKNSPIGKVHQGTQNVSQVNRNTIESFYAAQGQLDPDVDARDQQPSPVPPPPPAPPDPLRDGNATVRKSSPTTGERIFNALRVVTSQSYIDASEFYNSVLASAQQVQRFTFPPESSRGDDTLNQGAPEPDVRGFYTEAELPEAVKTSRGYDLYSPELNFEAHRTAQEVYNSLQDPPASPLLLKDLSQEPHPYMMDPSFTRTSEDIFNSLEQRRKSMERVNGFHDYADVETPDPPRRRSSQDLYAALEEVQMKRRISQPTDDIYGNSVSGDGAESTSDRRGSQGPEPEPPPDEANLKRAVSCETVCSDTSVVLDDLQETPLVGHLCVGLEYERWGGRGGEGDLTVSVLEARDLVNPDGRPAQDTFVRVCLLPDRQTHVQTRLYRGCPSPSYQEKFLFPLDGGPVGRALLVEVFAVDIAMGGSASLIAEASLKLGPAPRPPATTWLPLIGPALPTPRLGELLFSLSYLPTAERLTLVVVKARNLRGANPLPGDTFVKVYLVQRGKKVHKKRTSMKKGEKSPIFNEAIIFSVPAHALQSIQLRLTVAESGEPRAYSVGHVIVGGDATGRTLAHWRQMLSALRRPVAMWHPLRK